MIVFSDVHLREDSADTVLGAVLPGIYQACLEHQDFEVACLGDLFHFRYKIDARVQNSVMDEFKRWGQAGIYLRILPGNHDQYDVSGRNVLELFGHLPSVQVYSQPTWDLHGLWVPYRKNPADMLNALSLPRPTGDQHQQVLWLHCGLRGARMNDKCLDSDGIPLEAFGDTWSTILSGHYHEHQQVGAYAYYVGSPWQTSALEAGQPKGYCRWLGGRLTFVPTHWGPRYHSVQLQAGQTWDLTGIRLGDEVRVTTVGAGAEQIAVQVGALLAEAGIRHTVTPEVEKVEARLQVGVGASLAQYASAYVDLLHGDLDAVRLMTMFGALTQGDT